MTTQLYNLAEVALKYALWPLLGILIIIKFHKELSSILSNLANAKNWKLGAAGLSLETKNDASSIQKTEEQADSLDITPTPSPDNVIEKKNNDWFDQVWKFFENEKIQEADAFFQDFIRAKGNSVEYEREHAFFLFVKYTFFKEESILNELTENIVRIRDHEKRRYYINVYIDCLENTTQYNKAIRFIEEEIEKAENLIDKSKLWIKLSHIHLKDLEINKANDVILNTIKEISQSKEKGTDRLLHEAYIQLAEIEKVKDEKFMYALCLDKAAEYDPTDKEILFSSAYQASHSTLNSLEITNYNKLITIDPKNNTSYNNMGVTAGKLGLKLVSSNYYINSEKLGNTLAMANIGGLLLDAGLYELAEEIAQKALHTENTHENVYNLISRIKTLKEEEFNKWDELKKTAFLIQKHLRVYTKLYYMSNETIPSPSVWCDDKNNKINLSITNNEININWNLDNEQTTIKGQLKNLTFNGIYSTKKQNSPSTLLGINEGSKTLHCLGYYEEDTQSLIIFSENLKNKFELHLIKSD